MPETVAAIVVTFNRSKLLCECLDALMRQTRPLDKIYIIDNASTDNTGDTLQSRGFLSSPDVKYVRLAVNTGGAGGFHEGMKRAFDDGYQWIWVMDDDAEASDNLCDQLLLSARNHAAKVVCPLIARPDASVENHHHKRLEFGTFTLKERSAIPDIRTLEDQRDRVVTLDANAFVGPMFHRDVIADTGLPNSALFISGDDTEYTYRATLHGFAVLLVPYAIMYHKDKRPACGNTMTPGALWKQYHFVKNRVYLLRHYVGLLGALLYTARMALSFLSPHTTFIAYKFKLTGAMAGFRIPANVGGNKEARNNGSN